MRRLRWVLLACLVLAPPASALAVAPPDPPLQHGTTVRFHLRLRVDGAAHRLVVSVPLDARAVLAPAQGPAPAARAVRGSLAFPVDARDPATAWRGWTGVYELTLEVPEHPGRARDAALSLSSGNASVVVPLHVPGAQATPPGSSPPPGPSPPAAGPPRWPSHALARFRGTPNATTAGDATSHGPAGPGHPPKPSRPVPRVARDRVPDASLVAAAALVLATFARRRRRPPAANP